MNKNRSAKILYISAALTLVIGLSGVARLTAQTDSIHTDELFEFGDGADPAAPGIADILGSGQPGPDWDDLFNADRTFKDSYDELGNAGSNGVPDFLDTWGTARGRRDAAFVADAIGDVGNPADDLGNAYIYTAFNDSLEMVIYAGAERLSTAPSNIVIELNKAPFSIDAGGQAVGERSVGDLRISTEFTAGLNYVSVERWGWHAVAESFAWLSVESLPISPEQSPEQCNAAGTLCTACNGVSIDGGAWTNYDASGPVADLSRDTFLEIGVNLGALLGVNTYSGYYRNRYLTFQVSTPQDIALGTFVRASKLMHVNHGGHDE